MNIKDVLEKSKKAKKAVSKKKTAKNVAIGAGIGTAVGLAAGILLAPESGKKTRGSISNNAKKAVKTIKEGIDKTKERVSKQAKKDENPVDGNETAEETSKK